MCRGSSAADDPWDDAGMATLESRQLSISIDRPFAEVYDYAANPANVPEWAPGLGSSIEQVDGRWFVGTEGGRIELAVSPPNPHGVFDHTVTLPSGEVIHNPLRVTPNGTGSEVVFSLRRQIGMTDEEFARDAGLVQTDLARLKSILEGR
jgi:hypothetical protein